MANVGADGTSNGSGDEFLRFGYGLGQTIAQGHI